ncbi:MAG: septum formation initiator [Actinocatenispora sp.]
MRTRRSWPARSLLAVVGWLAAVAVATSIGVFAVDAIGSNLVGSAGRPLTQDQVDRTLARSSRSPAPGGSASPTAGGSTGASPTPTGSTRVINTRGGTIVAGCRDGLARLLSWSPAQSYRSDDIERGPDRRAEIKFESDSTEVHVRVECVGGTPTAREEVEPED